MASRRGAMRYRPGRYREPRRGNQTCQVDEQTGFPTPKRFLAANRHGEQIDVRRRNGEDYYDYSELR